MITYKGRKYILADNQIHLTLDDLLNADWRIDSNSIYDEANEEVDVDEFIEATIDGVNIAVKFGGGLENIYCEDNSYDVNFHGSLEDPGTLEVEEVVTDRPVVVHFQDESALLNEDAPAWVLDDVFAEFVWFGKGPKLFATSVISKGSLGAYVFKELGCA